MLAYLDVIQKVLGSPDESWKPTRTGERTKAVSGAMFEHNMADGFPLLTTKRMALRLVATELEFFIKGQQDKTWLQTRDCHIWDEWCNPRIVPYQNDPQTKARMLAESDLGRVYGVQWRDYNGNVDQLAHIVNTLKTDPADRRMVCSAWNPSELDQQAPPPATCCGRSW